MPHRSQHLVILLVTLSSPFFFSIFWSSFYFFFFHTFSSQEQKLKLPFHQQASLLFKGPADNLAFRVSLTSPVAYQGNFSKTVPILCGVLASAVRTVNVSPRYMCVYKFMYVHKYFTCSYKIIYLDVFIYRQTIPKQFLWGQ